MASAEAGTTAYDAPRWVSTRGEQEPWSEGCAATVAAQMQREASRRSRVNKVHMAHMTWAMGKVRGEPGGRPSMIQVPPANAA